MRAKINIDLDFDGIHTFDWHPSDDPGAVEVPRELLERWTREREAFQEAFCRWKGIIDEVEDALYRTERERVEPGPKRTPEPAPEPAIGEPSPSF